MSTRAYPTSVRHSQCNASDVLLSISHLIAFSNITAFTSTLMTRSANIVFSTSLEEFSEYNWTSFYPHLCVWYDLTIPQSRGHFCMKREANLIRSPHNVCYLNTKIHLWLKRKACEECNGVWEWASSSLRGWSLVLGGYHRQRSDIINWLFIMWKGLGAALAWCPKVRCSVFCVCAAHKCPFVLFIPHFSFLDCHQAITVCLYVLIGKVVPAGDYFVCALCPYLGAYLINQGGG